MKNCPYCQKQLNEEETACIFCGYDQNTKTINNAFKAEMAQTRARREKEQRKKEKLLNNSGSIDPRVKKFASLGLAVTAFSLFFKHSFNISSVVRELSKPIIMVKEFKFLGGKSKNNKDSKYEKIELTDVKSFNGNKKPLKKADLKVEGIFFDPRKKSFVFINGKVLSEGDTVDEVTVKKINRDSVELVVEGENKVLGMGAGEF